jgi:hypothetical protein
LQSGSVNAVTICRAKTPMDRLQNFTKRIFAVPKAEVEREEQKWQKDGQNVALVA